MNAFFLDFPSDWIVHKPQQTIRNNSRGKDLLPGPPPSYRYPSTVNNGAAVVFSSPRNRPATAANSTSTNHSRSARNFHDDKKNLSSSSARAPLCRLSQTKDVPSFFVGKPPPTSQQHTPVVRDVSTAQQPATPEDFAPLPQRQQHQQQASSPRHPSALPREQRLAQRHRWRLPLRTERARPSSFFSTNVSSNVVHAEATSSSVTGGATTPTTTADASLIYRDVYYAALDCLWHLLSLDNRHCNTEGGDEGNGTGNSNNTQSSSRSALQWLTTLVDTEVVPLLHHCCCWSEPSSSRPPRTTTTITILPATAGLTSSIDALFLVREAVLTVRQLRSAAAVQQPELLLLSPTASGVTANTLSLTVEEALLELDRQIAAALRRGGVGTAGNPDAALYATTSASSTATAVESLDGLFALCFRRHATEAPALRQKYLPKSTALLQQFHVDYQQDSYPPSVVAHGDEKKTSQRRGGNANVEENTAAEPPPSISTPTRPPPAATATNPAPTRPQSAPSHRAYLAFRRPLSASTSANTSAAANSSYGSKERKLYHSRELVVCRTMESALHEDDHLAQALRQSVLRCVASLRCTATSCPHCGGVFRQIGLGLVAQGRSSVQQQQHGASHHVSAEMFVLFLLLQFSQRWSVLNSSSSTGRPSRCVVTESQADEEAMEIVRDQFLRLHPVVVASEGSWWPSHVAVGIQLKWFGRMRSGGGQPPPHQGSNSSQQQQRLWLAMERRRVHPDRLQNAIGVVAQQIRQSLGKRILQHGGGVGVKNNTTRSSPSSCVGCPDLLQTSPSEAATVGEGATTSVFSSSSVNHPVPLEVLLQVLEGPLREAILAVATEVSQRINSAL